MKILFASLVGIALVGTFSAAGARAAAPTEAAQVTIGVTLHYRNEALLDKLVTAQSDPASPVFRHFITAAQFRDAFAPSQEQYGTSVRALQRAGFSIQRTFSDRSLIVARAPVGNVERLFGTKLLRESPGDGRIGYTHGGTLALPASLNAEAILGLDGLEVAPPAVAPSGMVTAPEASTRFEVAAATAPLYGPDGGFGPTLVRKAYDFPSLHDFDGSGVHVGEILVTSGSSDDRVTNAFLKHFNIKRTGPATVCDPRAGLCGFNTAPGAQQNTEWTVALAPGVAVDEHPACSASPSLCLTTAYRDVIAANADDVVMSDGAFQERGQPLVVAEVGRAMKEGAALGITFVSTSGGSNSLLGRGFVSTPADEADGTAAFASDLTTATDGSFLSESADPYNNGTASSIIPRPAFQTAYFGSKGGRTRLLPDISAPVLANGKAASSYVRVLINTKPVWVQYVPTHTGQFSFYGTLHGATVAALFAEYVQMKKGRLGNVAATLYQLAKQGGLANGDLRDITSGCTVYGNSICAGPGWDAASGLGSPGGYTLGLALR